MGETTTIRDQLTGDQLAVLDKAKAEPVAAEESFQARADGHVGGGASWLYFRSSDDSTDDVAPWWSPQRDLELRRFVHLEGNDILQGAQSSLVKKFKAMNWVIEGPESTVARMQPVIADESEFGRGWGELVSKTVEDYTGQDVGAYWELVGKGEPDGPLEELPTGIAHLDAGLIHLTGDPAFPVLFSATKDSARHKIHTTRVVKMTDMVSPNQRMCGVGFCGVSRVLASSRVLLRLARYKREKLSDLPPAGLLVLQNIMPSQWADARRQYEAETRKIGNDLWKSVMTLTGLDPQKSVDAKFINFAQLPEQFNEQQSTEIYINIVALAFGVDVREFWPMSAGPLGTGTETAVQHQKAKGKGIGDLISTLERSVNWHLLPKRCSFRFDFQDDEEDQLRAEIESRVVGTIMSMWQPEGPVEKQEIRQMLADQCGYFSDEYLAMDLTDTTDADDTEQKMFGSVVRVDRFGRTRKPRRKLGRKASMALDRAMDNYRAGNVEAGDLAEFALLEMMDDRS